MSGWRRMVPVESRARRAGPRRTILRLTRSWRRRRRCWRQGRAERDCAESILSRVLEMSTATTEAPASASCAVLPPGAAQRSTTRLPALAPADAPAARRRRPAPTTRLPRSRAALRCGPWAGGARFRRKHASRHLLGPMLRLALHREVERRLDQIGGGDQHALAPRRSARPNAATASLAC